MPEYLAPGVYVEEIQTGNKPIEGVSTSTSGLVGVTERGPVNVPQLVTSYGEYRRLFGGYLPASDFTDGTGRVHAYLPHAIEGFFLNGGKRAYITRVLPDVATFASRNLFFADPSLVTPGDTVLLRPAQQGSGTTVNPPLLYVLDPSNFLVNDWVRIGDGSRAEYRQVQALAPDARHVSLNFPTHYAHPAGAIVSDMTAAPAAGLVNLILAAPAAEDATTLTVGGADVPNLIAAFAAPGSRELLRIGSVTAAEYVFATAAVASGAGEAVVTLDTPLRVTYAAGSALVVITLTLVAQDNLDLAASADQMLIYLNSLGADFDDPTHVVVIGVGSPEEEVISIGSLASLPLDVGTYATYPAGSTGLRVTVAVDDRTVVDLPSATVLPLDDVTGISAGMTLAQGANTRAVAAVDPLLRVITAEPPLPAAPAVGSVVTVGGNNFTVSEFPTSRIVPLDTANGVNAGMTLVHGGNSAIVAHVDAVLQLVVLQTSLPAAPADGAPVTIAGNGYTARRLRRPHVLPLSDVAGLEPGMSVTVGGDTRVIDAVHTGLSTIRLQTALPALPAAGTAVAIAARHLTADSPAGAIALALDNRLGLGRGDVLRIGATPNEEYVTINSVAGDQGAPPDAGAVILTYPTARAHAAITEVRRVVTTVDLTRQPVFLPLHAPRNTRSLLVTDGTSYAIADVIRITTPDGMVFMHSLSTAAQFAAPREIEISAALERGHDAGLPFVERVPLLEIRALDAGSWGDRLLVACREETKGLVANAEVLNANPPPGPGMFSSLQLSSLTGVEPGTILEVLDPDGNPLDLPFLKVRRVDRPNRLALLDPPGLQAAHMSAHNNALLAGQRLRLRSLEFSLIVMLRQQPDPAVPTRDENLLDQEVFRYLSMDPRHSRYVMRIVGATWIPGNPDDDLGIPLRRWDRRSEGASDYVRVLDLEANPADREVIRLGPEALVDLMPSGLTRPARHPFSGGNDAVVAMNDAMYAGIDNTEPDLRTGLYTLKNLLTVSLVAIPGQTSAALQQALIDHCEEMRYRFAVLDGPRPPNDTLTDVQNHRQQYDTKYAALYHPWLMLPDPFPTSLATIRQYPIPPSGHLLGIYARVDNERGVHKAPANEVVRGIVGLTRYFTKGEQDILNPYPVNINVVRDFRPNNRAIRVWGARCITSDNDYKYVNVRRLLIFLEDSIDRGLQWVVFEPNAEELWARVRRAVINFLTTVWRNGALEGTTPEQGFFVKCDRTTMTRDDIDNGRLICVIGVAPVKPAEFVIIRIGLWTADAQQ